MRWLGDRIVGFLEWLALKLGRDEGDFADLRWGDHLRDTTQRRRKGRWV